MKENFKSGFVAIIGRPNVGKSTLMNHLIGQKIAITSNKPQTTRNKIQTVYTCDEGQIVFLDTPGIHKAKNKLGEYMVQVAERTLKEVDAIMWLVEPSTFVGAGERHIAEQLQKVGVPVILIINKIDTVKKEELLPAIDTYRKICDFAEIIPCSALRGNNTQDIIPSIFKYLPYGPMFYDEDTVTDQPQRQIAAEIIREKALHALDEEIPHGIAVAIDQMKERKGGGMFDIDACAVAVDVTSPDRMCTIAGTWSINEYIAKEPVMDGTIAMNSLFAMPGYYLVEECSATSSGNLEWYLENCMENEKIPEGENIYSVVNAKVASVKPEECDVYFLPFLYGSNAHPLGKGAFIGLTTYHNKAHMLRAIYEGVVFSHKTHIERLLLSRERPEAIRMAGGAANSEVWVQMFADILGFPIETVDAKELGALGCGMAAAIAAGVYKDYEDAAKHMVHVSGRVEPNPQMHEIYQKKYEKYHAVSKALDTVWGQFEV